MNCTRNPTNWIIALILFSFCSCSKMIQYHPNEIRLDEEDRNLNDKNIARIAALPHQDSFKIVVIGDTQRFYDELDDFVAEVNQRDDISFVLINGDITDFGINREFKWISRSLRRLNVPFVSVIGNHDMLANGRQLFREMFGAENFQFSYSGYQFICLNTNALEDGFEGTIPDLAWLESALDSNQHSSEAFVFSHIPPFDNDFDPALESGYVDVLLQSGRVRYSIHAHQHRYTLTQPYGPELNLLVVADMNKRKYAVLSINNGIQHIEQVEY
ncbi:MAG: metallophosphoesterase family protein [Chitinophagaceae bacterium]